MRKLVQKVVEIDTSYSYDKDVLQKKLDELSKDGWELCGQIGIFHIVKRWEEETRVYQGGYCQPQDYGSNRPYTPPYNPGYMNNNGYGYGYNNYRYGYGYNNGYNQGFNGFPNFNQNSNQPYGYQNPQPQPQQQYNPSVFGTPVFNDKNNYNNSKEDEDED